MDFSDGALPMGMVFFGLMVGGALRRKAGHVAARAQYPRLAQQLGLTYIPSSYKSGVGKLEGVVDGYRVSVDPDDQRRIYVRMNHQPLVALHSYEHNRRPPQGAEHFRPASSVLAARFKTSHASAEVARRLNAAEGLGEMLKPLQFLRALKSLSVTESGVTAIFDYGNPPFIPADVVATWVPRLVFLARVADGDAFLAQTARSGPC